MWCVRCVNVHVKVTVKAFLEGVCVCPKCIRKCSWVWVHLLSWFHTRRQQVIFRRMMSSDTIPSYYVRGERGLLLALL